MKLVGLIIVFVLFLTGCVGRSLGDFKSSDQIVLTDAAQRAITVVSVDTDDVGELLCQDGHGYLLQGDQSGAGLGLHLTAIL